MASDAAKRESVEMTPEERVVFEAKKRFKRCESYEQKARNHFVQDTKFANADAYNHWQWEDALRRNRELDQAPCLTINKVRQHNLQIINDARQNKPSVSVKAVGNGATYEAAEVFEGVIRHIEYVSNAQAAYDTATIHQVEGGIGYWRIVTDYADEDTFDQEIFIQRVKDALSVYLDPDIKELDGSDAQFGFVFDDMERDVFEKKYPRYKEFATRDPLGNNADASWMSDTKVRVAEYFRRVEVIDELLAVMDAESGAQTLVRASKLPAKAVKELKRDPETKIRTIVDHKVERYVIVGDRIAEEGEWAGKYVPIVRVPGEEIEIEGKMDRRGHTRALLDPQRMYNYWSSSAVENVALQSKTPYVGPMEAFENLEKYWDTANTVNHAWLPYNGRDDKGDAIAPPQRQPPPVMPQAYMQGLTIASDEMRAVSGQYQSEMGMPSNEKSGVAIMQRQRQGDNATYHYIDHLAAAIRYTGKQLIDLIPKIYDTPRIIKILAEDGVEYEVEINPSARQAYLQEQKQQAETVKAIFNPNVGKYDVEADIGPAYATRRQEAFNAFMQIAQRDGEIMKVAGDLMFKAADFPMADELAERFRRMIPPNILGEAPPPQMEAMQQQMQHLQGALVSALQTLEEEKRKRIEQAQQKDIDAYKAETDRLNTIIDGGVIPDQIQQLIAQLVADAMKTDMGAVVDASDALIQPAAEQGEIAAQEAIIRQAEEAMQQQPDEAAPMDAPDMMAVGE